MFQSCEIVSGFNDVLYGRQRYLALSKISSSSSKEYPYLDSSIRKWNVGEVCLIIETKKTNAVLSNSIITKALFVDGVFWFYHIIDNDKPAV